MNAVGFIATAIWCRELGVCREFCYLLEFVMIAGFNGRKRKNKKANFSYAHQPGKLISLIMSQTAPRRKNETKRKQLEIGLRPFLINFRKKNTLFNFRPKPDCVQETRPKRSKFTALLH